MIFIFKNVDRWSRGTDEVVHLYVLTRHGSKVTPLIEEVSHAHARGPGICFLTLLSVVGPTLTFFGECGNEEMLESRYDLTRIKSTETFHRIPKTS